MTTRAQLQIIGGGRMGEALLGGLVSSGWATPEELRIVEVAEVRRQVLRDQFPGVDVAAEPGPADGTVLATKPTQILEVAAVAVRRGGGAMLSIAAGITIAQLEAAVGSDVAVIRAMPNTPCLVGRGVSAISGGSAVSEDELRWAEGLLGAVGTVVRVPESSMDAVTGLSGSGPAYLFLVAEALVDAGVLVGLPRDVAVTLAHQTLLGASTLLVESEDTAAELRAAVTSPGGTTAAGLRALETAGVRAAVIDAVVAAAHRSAEMSAGQVR